MIIQTDADGTIYRGNLLVSLGWKYIHFLFKKGKYGLFLKSIFKLPFFYFLSRLPSCMNLALEPFYNCPIELVDQIKKPIRKKWLNFIEKNNPEKIIIISRQEKNLLRIFIENSSDLKKYRDKIEIISNSAVIKDDKFTGEFMISIGQFQKQGYVDDKLIYLGDLSDYLFWGRKNQKFILI
jgi:hypothetical protein